MNKTGLTVREMAIKYS